jgi:hypothetical protein
MTYQREILEKKRQSQRKKLRNFRTPKRAEEPGLTNRNPTNDGLNRRDNARQIAPNKESTIGLNRIPRGDRDRASK